jgi:8-amino-7-oxononanoate synthase
LYVDEAHSLGVYGRDGAGRCAEAGVRPDILVGTLGKAVGTEGAFVAGSQALRAYLWNRARTFVFSTAPSPAISAQTLAHVKRLRKAPSLQVAVLERAHEFREALKGRALRTPPGSFGPVVAVLVGAAASALAAAELLRKQGILTQAIRPPTVPEGSSRLRITISAGMSSKDVLRLADALAAALEQTCAASS